MGLSGGALKDVILFTAGWLEQLHKIYAIIILAIRKSGIINFLLFGFLPGKSIYANYWDWTTLLLKKALKTFELDNKRILDIGTGPYAILSIYVKCNSTPKQIVAADYLDEILGNAITQPGSGGITFVLSDLFENIQQKFDVILFNAPYIIDADGSKLGIFNDELARERWSGGETGMETINRFLEFLPEYLSESGYGLLGVNHFYLSDPSLRETISQHNKLVVTKYLRNRLTRAGVYIIQREDL